MILLPESIRQVLLWKCGARNSPDLLLIREKNQELFLHRLLPPHQAQACIKPSWRDANAPGLLSVQQITVGHKPGNLDYLVVPDHENTVDHHITNVLNMEKGP